jgi:hypothetical protein
MKPEIEVEFCILGTRLPPEEIARLVGIHPTRMWNIGDFIQQTADGVVQSSRIRRKENAWCLSIKNDRDAIDLVKLIRQLLQIVEPKAKIIKQICIEFELECEISCVIYAKDETPIVNFTPDVLSSLANLKATLDFDIILLGSQ